MLRHLCTSITFSWQVNWAVYFSVSAFLNHSSIKWSNPYPFIVLGIERPNAKLFTILHGEDLVLVCMLGLQAVIILPSKAALSTQTSWYTRIRKMWQLPEMVALLANITSGKLWNELWWRNFRWNFGCRCDAEMTQSYTWFFIRITRHNQHQSVYSSKWILVGGEVVKVEKLIQVLKSNRYNISLINIGWHKPWFSTIA